MQRPGCFCSTAHRWRWASERWPPFWRWFGVRAHINPDELEGAKEDRQSGYIDNMLTLEHWAEIVEYVTSAGPVFNFVVLEPNGGRIVEVLVNDSAFVHRSVHMNFCVDV